MTSIQLYKNTTIRTKMNLVKLTPENVHNYIGFEILFQTRGSRIIKKIINVSNTGKSIQIEHEDLHNNLQIVTKNVYAILK